MSAGSQEKCSECPVNLFPESTVLAIAQPFYGEHTPIEGAHNMPEPPANIAGLLAHLSRPRTQYLGERNDFCVELRRRDAEPGPV